MQIHLDNAANENRTVNPQTAIVPLLCQSTEDKLDFRDLLKARLLHEHPKAEVEQVLDYELSFYDTQKPSLVGLKQEFIASARLDNLLSCFTGLEALLQCDGAVSAMLVCNDHEEVGSMSTSGAAGPLLTSVLNRLAGNPSIYAELAERSMMISTDNAHAVHPNFADQHDEKPWSPNELRTCDQSQCQPAVCYQ